MDAVGARRLLDPRFAAARLRASKTRSLKRKTRRPDDARELGIGRQHRLRVVAGQNLAEVVLEDRRVPGHLMIAVKAGNSPPQQSRATAASDASP